MYVENDRGETRRAGVAACGCVDIHTHVVPHDFPPYGGRRANVPWPSMAPAHACHRHVMISEKIYRTVSDQCWDLERRLADMDARNVAQQVLSPMPELLSYWMEPDDGAALARYTNELIANMVSAAPGRFAGLAAVPLQDVDTAISELDYAVNRLGLAGAEIGSNVNGVAIGDARFDPFFEAAARWNAAIFVHAIRPAGMDRIVGSFNFEQVLCFPGEIGLAAASMITGGMIARHPNLRIAFSHGGGSLQVLVARLQHAWEVLPALRQQIAEAPRVQAGKMFYDDLLYDADAIRNLIRAVGATQVMVGTDYPFVIMDQEPDRRALSLELSTADSDLLRFGNARRWLGERGKPSA